MYRILRRETFSYPSRRQGHAFGSHRATTLLLESAKIRGHYRGAMLIHAHRSATLSNDRKTEDRPDLGATPPPGPIKEGYPIRTRTQTASSCLFSSPRTPYVSYDLPLHTGERYIYTGVLSGVSLSLSLYPLPYLRVRLRICPTCIGVYMPHAHTSTQRARVYGNLPHFLPPLFHSLSRWRYVNKLDLSFVADRERDTHEEVRWELYRRKEG